MPDGDRRYPNPTFGLSIWGPLIPASDCRPCLYALSIAQGLGGLALWWLPGRAAKAKYNINNSMSNIWKARLLRTAGLVSGTYLMLLASLEFVRLQLPSDPWAEDAALARKKALQAGEQVSMWFGPKGYQPVQFSEWKRRVDQSLNQEQQRRRVVANGQNVKHLYDDIREKNRSVADKILHDLHNNVRFPVAEEFQEDDAEYKKANEALLEDLKNEEIEWDVMEPWEQLEEETDILVRFMPHSRNIAEEFKNSSGSSSLEAMDPGTENDSGSIDLHKGIN